MGSGGAQGDARFVAAYLDRLGLPDSAAHAPPDLGSLAALVRAHLYTVPFENLDIWRGVELSLAIDALFDKIVRRRRGGFCYELNGLFAVLLERLGYRVCRYSARVMAGERTGPPFDHLALGVAGPDFAGRGGKPPAKSSDMDFAEQLIDIGFGEGPRAPMPLTAGCELDDVAGRWRQVRESNGELRLELTESRSSLENGSGYLIDPNLRSLSEFSEMCRYHQSSPDSPFTRGPRCTLAFDGGRITVTETSRIEWDRDGRREREVTDLTAELAQLGVSL